MQKEEKENWIPACVPKGHQATGMTKKKDCHSGFRAAWQCRKQKAKGLQLTFDDLLSHFIFKM
ncbi:MAG: hypothetical protein ABSC11_05360 [Smithella sp.]|jgi:hypothetical protein